MDPDQHHNALNRHDKLHWYEIQSILGQGGFGITYLARDTNLDQLVAIKEYLPTEFSTRDKENTVQPISENHTEIFDWGKRRFLEEAKTLAQFRHPNVVRVSSFFENNNTGYMVMDYEDGTDLARLIKAGETFDEQRILDLMIPILDGLDQIHAQGFIHRDIKPANIFIRSDGSPVLIDFGSARQAIGGQTRTMTSLVTPGFAPFEQYHDAEGKQGPWTDIYSLGATCYAMITGKPPNDALKRGMARLDHSTDAYLHLIDLRAGKYSEHLLQAIDHALEFKQTERPQSVSEWRAMLLGETAVPQANIATQIRDKAATDTDPATVATTQIVTRPDSETPDTDPGPGRDDKTRLDTRPDTETPATEPDVATVPVTAPPASTEPEVVATATQPQAPAAKKRKTIPAIIIIASILGAVAGLVLISKTGQQPASVAETPPAAVAKSEVEAEARQKAEDSLAAEKEKLRQEQARFSAEREQLAQEKARIEEEKKLQAEQARIAAEKKRQVELARKKVAQQKQQQELARKQAEEKKRQQAALAQQQHKAVTINLSGTYIPDRGFENLVLTQTGNQVKGTIGNKGSSLEGVVNGNRLEFTFDYSRTGRNLKKGSGVLTLSDDGKRLSGTRSNSLLGTNSPWNLALSDGAHKKKKVTDLFADLSGVYLPNDGFVEKLQLEQIGNRVKGTIGKNGSTLEGRRKGNKLSFEFSYSRTGYGFKEGYGELTISPNGKRLTGFRSKGGFAPNSPWSLKRKR